MSANEQESAGELLERLGSDAAKWAKEFRNTAMKLGYSDMDEDWLIGWFANAIEHSCAIRSSTERREREGYRWKPIETLSEDIDFFACQLSSYTSTYLEIGGGYSFEGKVRAFNAFGESFKPSHWMELPAAPDGEST